MRQQNGVATLDSSGRISSILTSQAWPAMFHVVDSEQAMLGLVAVLGDVVLRSDLQRRYILTGDDPLILANWHALGYVGYNAQEAFSVDALTSFIRLVKIGVKTDNGIEYLSQEQVNQLECGLIRHLLDAWSCSQCSGFRDKFIFLGQNEIEATCLCGSHVTIVFGNQNNKLDKEYEEWA